jgi:hypothetical protein
MTPSAPWQAAPDSAGPATLPLPSPASLDRSARRPRLLSRWITPVWALVALGLGLRLAEFASGRALWHDEAALALNILQRSFADLFRPLEFDQGAPVGFLLAVKAVVLALGRGELALRLLPLLSGCLALLAFYPLARRLLPSRAVPVAVGLFAVLPGLVYYSGELKQYSTDVLVVVLLLWVGAAPLLRPGRPGWRRLLGMGLVGAAAVWLSHPAVFVLGGVGFFWAGAYLRRRDWTGLGRLALTAGVWGLSFAGCYLVSLRYLGQNAYLHDYWKDHFLPLPPHSLGDLAWPSRFFFRTFRDLICRNSTDTAFLPGVAILAFLAGCVGLWRGQRGTLLLALAPLPFLLAAAALHKYPASGRLVLFLAPSLVLVIAAGVEELRSAVGSRCPGFTVILLTLLFFGPVRHALGNVVEPEGKAELKTVLEQVSQHRQAGDWVYVHKNAWPAFVYYSDLHGFPQDERVVRGDVPGRIDGRLDGVAAACLRELQPLRGHKRVWVIVSTIQPEVEDALVLALEQWGPCRCKARATGSSAYLFDLKR